MDGARPYAFGSHHTWRDGAVISILTGGSRVSDSQSTEALLTHLTWIGLAGAFALLVAISQDYGVTWDTPIRILHGEMIVDYYASGFEDDTALHSEGPNRLLRYYGAGFDSLNEVLHRFLQTDIYAQRHLLNALCAFVMLLFSVRTARFCFGPAVGLLSLVLLFCWPRFIGHAANNPKDIPFAAVFIMVTFFLVRFATAKQLRITKDFVWFTLSTAMCVLVRPGGLILLAYFGTVLLVIIGQHSFANKRLQWKSIWAAIPLFVVATAGVLVLSSLFWPWALQSPLTRPVEALLVMGQFPQNVPNLFQGSIVGALDLPWHYIPTWFAITAPLGVLAAFCLGVGYAVKDHSAKVLYCLGFGLFPVVYAILSNANLYDGIRHMLFIYPFVAVLGGYGVWRLTQDLPRPAFRSVVVVCILGIGLGPAVLFSVVNHPNQVVYFNSFTGGTEGAFLRYDLDYWGNCYAQSVDWLNEKAKRENVTYTVKNLTMFPPSKPLLKKASNLRQVDSENAAYGIHLLRFRLRHKGALAHIVSVGDAPLCLTIKDPRLKQEDATGERAQAQPGQAP